MIEDREEKSNEINRKITRKNIQIRIGNGIKLWIFLIVNIMSVCNS